MTRWNLLFAVLLVVGCQGTRDEEVSEESREAKTPAATMHLPDSVEAMKTELHRALPGTSPVLTHVAPNGARAARIQGESTVMVARKNAGGAVESECFDNAQAAERFLDRPATGDKE